MKKNQTVKMPLEYVKKTLSYHGLEYIDEKLPNGSGIQLWLLPEGFSHVNVNAYKTGSVVVQPYGDPAAVLVSQMLALRAARLRRKGKIRPS